MSSDTEFRTSTASGSDNVDQILLVGIDVPELQPGEIGSDLQSRLSESLEAGRSIELLGFRWVISDPHWRDFRYLFAELHAFVDRYGPFSGYPYLVVPLAIDVSTLTLAIPLNPPILRVTEAVTVVATIMSLGRDSSHSWQFVSVYGALRLEQWIESIDSLQGITFELRPPNPNYRGREFIRELIEATEAQQVNLSLQARSEESLAAMSHPIYEAVTHVDDGYGNARALGMRTQLGGVQPEEYHTSIHGVPKLVPAELSEGKDQADRDELSRVLLEHAQEA